jgi:predicted HicB family RNase H-like nuclease
MPSLPYHVADVMPLAVLCRAPERPFKGSFNVRIQPELHRKAALAAATRGLSLNAFVEDAIRNNVNQP